MGRGGPGRRFKQFFLVCVSRGRLEASPAKTSAESASGQSDQECKHKIDHNINDNIVGYVRCGDGIGILMRLYRRRFKGFNYRIEILNNIEYADSAVNKSAHQSLYHTPPNPLTTF